MRFGKDVQSLPDHWSADLQEQSQFFLELQSAPTAA